MFTATSLLLRRPGAVFRLAANPPSGRLNAGLALPGLLAASAWGAAMGCYCGGVQIVVTTVKMPLFFAITLGLCFALMHVTQLAGGLRLRAGQTLAVTLSGLTLNAMVLGSLAPILALFCACAPFPAPSSYLNLYVTCALAGMIAGVFGARNLALGLRALAPPGRATRGIFIAWLFIYQFVGAQVAWTLRPWLGSSADFHNYYSLEHGLSGNFYVGVSAVALRWLKEIGVMP